MVSIVLAVYNAEKHIKRTVESLINQSYTDIEIIFVDDGSTDLSGKLLDEASMRDERIVVIHQKNMGPGKARNNGLKQARGEYVVFLDVDDLFDEDLVRSFYDRAVETNAEIVISSALRYDEEFDIVKPFPGALHYSMIPYEKIVFSPLEISDRLYQITGGFVWNKFFKKSFLDCYELKFAEEYCYEDMALYCTAAVRASKIAITHKELVKYRVNAGQSISDNKDKYVDDLINVISFIKEYLLDSKLYSTYEQTYLNRILSIIVQVFKAYTSQEAFVKLFYFVKDNLQKEFQKHVSDYYSNENNFQVLTMIYESDSPLELALKIHTKRSKESQDVFYKYWPVPYEQIGKNKKIAIYGAGDVGRDVYIQLKSSNSCDITLWVDSAKEKYIHKGYPVRDKKELLSEFFDILLICIRSEEKSEEVINECIKMGVQKEKIIKYPSYVEKDLIIRRLVENE